MSKVKGSRTERELFHKLWKEGFACSRVAGSGSTILPAADLIAGKKGRVLAIECKSGKTSIKRYLQKKQIDELKQFSKKFGAEPWIGMRYDNEEWLFLELKHLEKVKSGNFGVNLKLAKKKGITFNELVGKYKQRKLK